MTLAHASRLVVFVPMLVEARRAARNERAQRARGGVEPRGDVYGVMRVAYPGVFLAMLAEGAVRGAPPAAESAGRRRGDLRRGEARSSGGRS